jgi:NAD(P)-dependent dehydrogenase (short-subunit alcohol dehydrogenase family)
MNASSIGRAMAIAFTRAGAHVVVADLSEQGNQETARAGGGDSVSAVGHIERFGKDHGATGNPAIGGANNRPPPQDFPHRLCRTQDRANERGRDAGRSAIEAVIGHMKTDGHLGRCYLKGRAGDAANAILSAGGYNLRLVLAWLRMILRIILFALIQLFTTRSGLKLAF